MKHPAANRPTLLYTFTRGAFLYGMAMTACTGSIEGFGEAPHPGGAPTSPTTPGPVSGTVVDTPAGGGPRLPPEIAGVCDRRQIGGSPLRRLTNLELANTLADLFPGIDLAEVLATTDIPADNHDEAFGFDNQAGDQAVQLNVARGYAAIAGRIASKVKADLNGSLGCDPSSDEACAASFLEKFGTRAFRRPLEPDEKTRFEAFFRDARAKYGVEDAIHLTLEAFLQSPQLLYRAEISPTGAGGATVPVSSYELATRMSYFLWATMPDAELFEAARSGRLRTAEDITTQARRMIASPRFKKAFHHFYAQWLQIEGLEGMQKDGKLYPAFTEKTGQLMQEEAERFFEHVFDEGVSYQSLFTADFSFVNEELARVYGLPSSVKGTAFTRAARDPGRAAGLLSQGAFLAKNADEEMPDPIRRGKFIREKLLCDVLPPVPDEIPPLQATSPNLSNRARIAGHSAGSCKACHQFIDDLGFAFEHFDTVGAWRADDRGHAIDDSGEIRDIGRSKEFDLAGRFKGPAELGRKLAQSRYVRSCVARQMFRFANGRLEDDTNDACSMTVLTDRLERSGGSLKETLIALMTTDAFLLKQAPAGGN